MPEALVINWLLLLLLGIVDDDTPDSIVLRFFIIALEFVEAANASACCAAIKIHNGQNVQIKNSKNN